MAKFYNPYLDQDEEKKKKTTFEIPKFEPVVTEKPKTGYERFTEPNKVTDLLGANIASTYGQTAVGQAQAIKGIFDILPTVKEGSVLGKLGFKPDTQVMENTIQDFETSLEPIQQKVASVQGPEKYVYSAVGQLPNMVANVLSPAAGLTSMGIGAGGGKAREIEQGGGSKLAQFGGGLASGALEVGSEAIQLKGLQNVLGSKGIKEGITAFATQALEEVVGESATQALDPYISKATIPEYELPKLKQQLADITDAGITAFVSSVLFGGAANMVPSAQKAMDNPTPENVTQALNDVEADMNSKGVDINVQENVQVQQPEITEPQTLSNATINNMKAPEVINKLQELGLPTVGTRSELRNSLKQASLPQAIQTDTVQAPVTEFATQPNAIAQEAQQTVSTEQIQGETPIIDKTAFKIPEFVSPETKTMSEDVGLSDTGASFTMTLDEVQTDISDLEQLNVEPELLAKHRKALDELQTKGVTKTTQKEFQKLIDIKNSIAPLKQKHKDDIAKVKQGFKEKQVQRKESATRTKLLSYVKTFNKQKLNPEFQSIANKMFGDLDPTSKSISKGKLTEFKAIQDEIAQLKEEGLTIDTELEKSIARLDKRQINDLSMDEVNELIDVAKELKTLNQLKNRTRKIEKSRSLKELRTDLVNETKQGKQSSKEIGTLGQLSSFLTGKDASNFKNVMLELGNGDTNSTSYKLFEAIREAQNAELTNKYALEDMLNETLGDYKQIASTKAWNKEQNINGRMLTSGEKVYLKGAVRDENVLKSLAEKGYVKGAETRPQTITKAEIDAIQLNENEQNVLDTLTEYFDLTYNLLNDAHVVNKGYALKEAGKGKYFPKKVSDLTLQDEIGQIFNDATLKGTGVIKDRAGSLNVLKMQDIFDVLERQKQIATKYNAYVNTLDDLNRIMLNPKVKQALRERYGSIKSKGNQSPIEVYTRDLIQDLQGTKFKEMGTVESGLKKIRTNAAPAILAYRMTTPLLQTMSYPIALGDISAKNLSKALTKKPNYNEMWDANIRARARKEGRIDREIAESANRNITDFGMKAISGMDKATVGRLWEATKLEVAETVDPNAANYLDEVSKKFDDVLDTQPNYTTLERSASLRTQDELAKAATMFGSAKSAVLNELKRGYVVGKNTGDWSLMKSKTGGYMTSILGMAAVRGLVKGLKGQDVEPDELLRDSLLGSLPGLDLFTSLFKGYDVGVMGLDTINDLGSAVKRNLTLAEKLVQGEDVTEKQIVNAFWDTADAVSIMYGIPQKNIREDLQIILRQLGLDTQFRRYTDPLSQADLYKEMANKLKSSDVNDVLSLIEQANVKGATIKKNMKEKVSQDKYIELINILNSN